MATKIFYVYKMIDPKNSKPFYVGKGSGDRYKHHEQQKDSLYNTTTHKNMLLKNKINKVLRESGFIRYQKRKTLTEQDAFNIEISLISKYGRRDNKTGILCNMTDGGEGVSGHTRSEEWKEKHRVAAHNRCQQIDQYSLNGDFIKGWKNYKDIINNIPRTDGPSINRCCNGKLRSAGGFRWTWSGEELKEWVVKPRGRSPGGFYRGKPVNQYTKDGQFIQQFRSVVAASNHIGKHNNTVRECCKGRSKSAGGFIWRFV